MIVNIVISVFRGHQDLKVDGDHLVRLAPEVHRYVSFHISIYLEVENTYHLLLVCSEVENTYHLLLVCSEVENTYHLLLVCSEVENTYHLLLVCGHHYSIHCEYLVSKLSPVCRRSRS